jgi:hypothetical protein
MLLSAPIFAELTLSPETIEFKDISASKTVFVKHDGNPVLPAEITKITSGVFKYRDDVPETASGATHFSNYSFMFDFRANEDGSITITPNKGLVEIGSYELYVHTVHGTVTGLIDANLNESHPPPVRTEVKLPELTYEIKLPDYEYGQLVSLDLYPDPENTYFWYINDKLHSSGPGETSFRAQLNPGSYEISFIARNPNGDVISRWSDSTEVSKK